MDLTNTHIVDTEFGKIVVIVKTDSFGDKSYHTGTVVFEEMKISMVAYDIDECINSVVDAFRLHLDFWLLKQLKLLQKK
jgi:hypothetical protein